MRPIYRKVKEVVLYPIPGEGKGFLTFTTDERSPGTFMRCLLWVEAPPDAFPFGVLVKIRINGELHHVVRLDEEVFESEFFPDSFGDGFHGLYAFSIQLPPERLKVDLSCEAVA